MPTRGDAMAIGENGFTVTLIFTVTETIPATTGALTGARISYFDIDKESKQITDAGLAGDAVFADGGNGNLEASIRDSRFDGNGGDGLDIGEEDEGNLFIRLNRVSARRNGSEGIKITEEGDGRLTADLDRVQSVRNAETGVVIEGVILLGQLDD